MMKIPICHKPLFSGLIHLLFVVALFVELNNAASFAAESQLPENPAIGSEVFIAKGCIRCHTILGVGGTVGPDLGNVRLPLSFMDLAGIMWNHSPAMERKFREEKFTRPKLTSEEMKNLIAFLYFLDYFDKPGDSERGAKLFQRKKCSICHSIGGQGGKVGKPLDPFKQYLSPVFMTTAMWNEGKKMAQSAHNQGLKGIVFRKDDVADILAYIRAAGVITKEYDRVYVSPGNPNSGQALFVEKKCVQCHTTAKLKEGTKIPLRALYLRGSLSQITGTIWNHADKMAEANFPLPELTEEEMADLMAYVYFLQRVDETGDPLRGKRLFQEKEKGCQKCHPLSGVGGDKEIAPDLATEKNLDTPIDIIRAMWNHGAEMEAKMQEKGVTWPKMAEGEIMDLMAFIRSQRAQKSQDKD